MEKLDKCEKCGRTIDRQILAADRYICPACRRYNKIPARERIRMLSDEGSFTEMWRDMRLDNLIGFPEYDAKRKRAEEKSGLCEAVVTGQCRIGGIETCLYVMDAGYMMASMGVVVGEKITRLFEYATDRRLPVVGFTASGGARMQEGMFSLLQMAKVSGALRRHSDQGLFYMAGLTDPTTGGINASFAQLGDVIFAEPGALIGFAGRRVIETTTGLSLPEDFQVAEKQLENGFLDAIVARKDQRRFLYNMLRLHTAGNNNEIL